MKIILTTFIKHNHNIITATCNSRILCSAKLLKSNAYVTLLACHFELVTSEAACGQWLLHGIASLLSLYFSWTYLLLISTMIAYFQKIHWKIQNQITLSTDLINVHSKRSMVTFMSIADSEVCRINTRKHRICSRNRLDTKAFPTKL